MGKREATVEVDPTDIRRLIKELDDVTGRRRSEAENRLTRMGVAIVGPLMIALRREAKFRRVLRGLLRFLALFCTLTVLGDMRRREIAFQDLIILFGCAVSALGHPIPSRRRNSLLYIVSRLEDPRCVGPLAAALQDGEIRKDGIAGPILDALFELLPRMQSRDRDLLVPGDLQAIGYLLTLRNDPLTITALHALEQIGDSTALPYLDRIRSKSPEVIAATDSCREYLLTRAELDEKSRTLLRAAEDSGDDVPLLRPARTPGETPDDRLLLPAGVDRIEEP